MDIKRWILLIAWIISGALIMITFLGMFVAPKLVSTWKSQGLKNVPGGWQMAVDIADFNANRSPATGVAIMLVFVALTLALGVFAFIGGYKWVAAHRKT